MAKFRWLSLLLWFSCIIVNAASPAQAQSQPYNATTSEPYNATTPRQATSYKHKLQAQAQATTPPLNTLLLQGFNWDSAKSSTPWYNVLKGIVDDAADAGITYVWFPPPSQSGAPEGYLPAKLYDLDSSYGSEQQLKDAVNAFHQKGIAIMGDIVINHRNGTKQDDKGYWCVFEGGKGDGTLDWGPWAVTVNDKPYPCGSGQADTGGDFVEALDVDHTNPKIQQDLSEWMNWLKSNVGFDGWRFDYVNGYAANLLSGYIQNTTPNFAVGEMLDSDRQKVVDWVHKTGDRAFAFDFPTRYILPEAFQSNDLSRLKDSDGKPAGMIGLLPQKAVTFIENHDTARPPRPPLNIPAFPTDKLVQGYTYILTHPGIPTIFYDHFVNGLKNEIKILTAIRKRNNINANSNCRIITAESDLYMAAIDEKIVMKIGPKDDVGKFNPNPSEFRIVASGYNYCVWEKNSSSAH